MGTPKCQTVPKFDGGDDDDCAEIVMHMKLYNAGHKVAWPRIVMGMKAGTETEVDTGTHGRAHGRGLMADDCEGSEKPWL